MKEKLEDIKKEILNCKKCSLYKTRTNPVAGEGNERAKVMFVGEAPGYWEDLKGVPFCGKAGEFLNDLLKFVGLKRKEVFIGNLLKCRPPENRDPTQEEISICSPYLERQIEAINPKVICPLGRYSMRFLMEKYGLGDQVEPITKIHGKIFKIHNLFQSLIIIPFFHPAVALYNQNMKRVLKEDFKKLKKLI